MQRIAISACVIIVGGRIPHRRSAEVVKTNVRRDVTLTRRAMDSLGVDNMVVFPIPMLFLASHTKWKSGWAELTTAGWPIKILSARSHKDLDLSAVQPPKEAERCGSLAIRKV